MGLVTLSSIALGSQVAHAADTDATKASTKSSVTFTVNDDVTPPVTDPTDPTKPAPVDTDDDGKDDATGDPMPDGETNTVTGTLTLDYVSNFKFGEARINKADSTGVNHFEIKPDGVQNNHAQVTDKQIGSNGWTLSVTASKLSGANGDLEGAAYVIPNAAISNVDGNTAPTTGNGLVTIKADGSETPVMTASAGEGVGTNYDDFGKEAYLEIALKNVSDTTTGDFTGTLDWNLAATPTTAP